ncbi:hypothetical protein SAMN04488029_4004 [Reichenbachiella faecimaris]|uniref:Uncharacterized protein n=1 Tax=Reichenbachiella faecimaris TaxID=692418 RepID=A0A1W2GRM2_REIFA|nr:hypothetical protein SAMN04488029_4004 [Reichenbachiella faecimaris]
MILFSSDSFQDGNSQRAYFALSKVFLFLNKEIFITLSKPPNKSLETIRN